MKKVVLFVLALSLSLTFIACNSKPRLRILNWGEYINDDVVAQFEELYDVKVVMSVADSNELFYSKIKSKTTAYDIVIPSDYMIEKMYDEGMLIKLDYSLLPNVTEVTYIDPVEQIFDSMTQTTITRTGETVDFREWGVPYFYGTSGLIYNNRIEGLEEALNEFGWAVYFESDNHFPNLRRGMYSEAEVAYAVTMFYLDNNPNVFSNDLLNQSKSVLQDASFIEWGNDSLKRNIEANNLDIAFTWTGDYLDRLYIQIEEGKEIDEVRALFDIYIPDTTMVFIDAMVIPYTAKNIEAAHQFINYLSDPEIAAQNAEVVGYAVATVEAFDIILSYLDSDDHWLRNWALANSLYYNLEIERTYYPLTAFNAQDIDKINSMIQDVIAK